MMQLVALGLAVVGIAAPLTLLWYFIKKREKRDRAAKESAPGKRSA